MNREFDRDDLEAALLGLDELIALKQRDPVAFFNTSFAWEVRMDADGFHSVAYMDADDLAGAVCADVLQAMEIDLPLTTVALTRFVRNPHQQQRVLAAAATLRRRGVLAVDPLHLGLVVPPNQLAAAQDLAGIVPLDG